jgi:hypothetical protein
VANVALSCGINPQALLVLMQKEQGLITDPAPPQWKYDSATGSGCPDTAPCDPSSKGFFNQVYGAAQQFKKYRLNPDSYNYVAGRYNTILYNPNRACGSSSVYIENQATAGLYDYTPYQPNAAALANLGGSGDSCSAYGNRNFWVYFNNWFGPTTAPAIQLAAGTSPSGVAVPGGFEVAVHSKSGTLWLDGPVGTGDTGLGVAAGTSPSIVAVPGGVQIAFQASTGHLWSVGALGNADLGFDMAPGTSPSIIAVPSGFEVAFQANTTAMWLVGALGNLNTGLGMAAGSSPSLTAVNGGSGFEAAFQANTTAMWLVGTLGNLNTGLGMAAGSSPSLTAVNGGSGFEAAFQANTTAMWLVGTLGDLNTGLGVASGSSPSIAPVSGGAKTSFQDGTNQLRSYG